jgi:hypothetical protein
MNLCSRLNLLTAALPVTDAVVLGPPLDGGRPVNRDGSYVDCCVALDVDRAKMVFGEGTADLLRQRQAR